MKKYTRKLMLITMLVAGLHNFSTCIAGTLEEKQMQVNGVSLSYIEQGEGTPVIFVHGAFSDRRVWEPQREAVANRFRFIAFTQRYFGTNKWVDSGEQYSQVNHTADLAEFIRKLDAGPVYIVGRSYGATVAVRMALQYPELVRGVIAQEPTIAIAVAMSNPTKMSIIKKERSELSLARSAAKKGDIPEATRLFADWTNDQPGGFAALSSEIRAIHLDNGRTIALHFSATRPPKITCADLGQLKSPLAITTGELTRPFFKILAQTTHDCVPGSQIIKIPDARHAATAQNPKAFNDALLNFLTSH
jgi:pimeloyl-ACP methyl ester carboxylesterase